MDLGRSFRWMDGWKIWEKIAVVVVAAVVVDSDQSELFLFRNFFEKIFLLVAEH